jgi:hypothetical protein
MGEVHCRDPRTGIVYVYASESYWDKEAKKKNEVHPGAVPEAELQRLKNNCSIYILADVFEVFKNEPEYAFLKECNQKVLQQSVRHLVKAFEDFFDPEQPKRNIRCSRKRTTIIPVSSTHRRSVE